MNDLSRSGVMIFAIWPVLLLLLARALKSRALFHHHIRRLLFISRAPGSSLSLTLFFYLIGHDGGVVWCDDVRILLDAVEPGRLAAPQRDH